MTLSKKLRVGVWLHDTIQPEKGGAYGYYNELVHAMSKYSFTNAEIVFLSNKIFRSSSFEIKRIQNNPKKSVVTKVFSKTVSKLPQALSPITNFLLKSIDAKNTKFNEEINRYVDVIYYLTPDCISTDVPYIYTHWDVGHMSAYAFPEFSMDGNFEYRKKHNDFIPEKALAIFALSEASKKECEYYLNINPNRIKIVPIFPSAVIHSSSKAEKPPEMKDSEFFIHYPAQFWAHKNHYNLVVSMISVVKKFPEIKLVLTGSDKGNKNYILRTIKEFGLENNILDLGFVEVQQLRWLYEHSHGLIMPTFLGPITMPPMEAAELGCPVACTNFDGHIEQLGKYGYYFNAADPDDIAKQIVMMIEDKQKGAARKYQSIFNMKNALQAIDTAFTELRNIRFCWDK